MLNFNETVLLRNLECGKPRTIFLNILLKFIYFLFVSFINCSIYIHKINVSKENLKNGIVKITSKRGHSKVWNVMGKIENQYDKELKELSVDQIAFVFLNMTEVPSLIYTNTNAALNRNRMNNQKISM